MRVCLSLHVTRAPPAAGQSRRTGIGRSDTGEQPIAVREGAVVGQLAKAPFGGVDCGGGHGGCIFRRLVEQLDDLTPSEPRRKTTESGVEPIASPLGEGF